MGRFGKTGNNVGNNKRTVANFAVKFVSKFLSIQAVTKNLDTSRLIQNRELQGNRAKRSDEISSRFADTHLVSTN